MPIDPKSVKWDAPDPASVQWDDAPKAPAMPTRAELAKREFLAPVRTVRDVAAGAVRGAGSIGATLFAPFDAAEDAIQRLVTGKPTGASRNAQRREAMTGALGSMGADTDSLAFGGSKVLTEVAGTLGVGPTLASMAPAALAARFPAVVEAVRTAGMSAGGLGGKAGLAARTAGGAVAGGAAAGLVNPEDAAAGAAIGAAAPGVLQVAGRLGTAAGNVMRGPAQSPEIAAAVQAARGVGYVIPPSQARPSLMNRVLEGTAGKLTTAQNASARNQSVTNRLAAEALGLPPDTKLTVEGLDQVRAEAGKAYAAIAKLGKFDATRAQLPKSVAVDEGISPLLAGKTKSVDAAELVRAWKQANADATAYYRAYGRDANPETLAKAKAAAGEAKQIDEFMAARVADFEKARPAKLIADFAAGRIDQETFLRESMTAGGKESMVEALKQARQRIAKTYSVEAAMNPMTGTVDARKLAKQLEKGKVLSGELKTAAQFAGTFPKAAQTVESMGSLPQTSPLDWIPAGAMSAGLGNPLFMIGVGARPAARAAALSGPVQNRLLQQPQGQAMNALQNPELQQFLLRGAPVSIPFGGL